jgi:threonyl-tRNA synthetase
VKLLLWHCSRLAYTDVSRSTRPHGIKEIGNERQLESLSRGRSVLVFVTVEATDGQSVVPSASLEITRYWEMVGGLDPIVVMPFAHLSHNLAKPYQANELIDELVESIASEDKSVTKGSFGTHKEIEICFATFGHDVSVAFREVG